MHIIISMKHISLDRIGEKFPVIESKDGLVECCSMFDV